MHSGPLVRISDAFGWRGFPNALFYEADNALRFELESDVKDGPLRLLRAMDRARVIANEIFKTSKTLTAIVSHYGGQKRTRRADVLFKDLAEVGFHHSFEGPECIPEEDEDYINAFGEDLYRHWYVADFAKSSESIIALLWASFSKERSISPKVRWLDNVYIADFARKIVVHPYDDRGLDVIATEFEVLTPLYDRLADWLLPYDREVMDAKFRRSPQAGIAE